MAMTQLQMELEELREASDGLLRAEDVVAFAAENPDSALHRQFTWDDDEAARQYRLAQARGLIRVHVTVLPRSTQTTRTYVSLLADRQFPGGGYRHIADVLGDHERRQQLLRQALREAERWRERYQALTELATIFDAIDSTSKFVELVNTDALDLAVAEIA